VKIKLILTLFLAAGLFFGCEPQDSSGESADTADSIATGSGENISPPPVKDLPEAEPKIAEEAVGSTYKFHDVVYDISLNVIRKAGAIDFTIDVSNLDNNCKHTVKGSATEKEGDLESREMDGEAVFVQEYVYNGKDCELYISIEMDSQSAAWISQGECKDIDPKCKMEPDGYLTLSN
jgi:hypothetical protein